MTLNTVIQLPDGRIGTICYNNLDGEGGVWGENTFEMPEGGFGDLPMPEFMLRNKDIEESLREWNDNPELECVGEDFIIIR